MTILAVLFDCIIGYILATKVKSKLKLTALLIPAGLLVSVIVVAVSAVLSGQLTAEHAVYIAGYTLLPCYKGEIKTQTDRPAHPCWASSIRYRGGCVGSAIWSANGRTRRLYRWLHSAKRLIDRHYLLGK